MKKSISIILALFSAFFLCNEKTANAQDTTYSYTGSIQRYVVPPCTSAINITATGGQGGGTYGGHGATFTGKCSVTDGQVLYVVVAGQGGTSIDDDGNGGGGGTYVFDSATHKLLVVAGGGGGAGYISNPSDSGGGGGADIVTHTCNIGGGSSGDSTNGVNGNGGGGGTGTGPGGGGAGWLSNGRNGTGSYTSYGGNDMANGFAGGIINTANNTDQDWGGYGGGGGGGYDGGGGGGGYNGGGGANDNSGTTGGAGGASYLNGTLVGSITNANTGNGSVTISTSRGGLITAGKVLNNVTCHGGNGGSAMAIMSGADGPYIYSWAPSGGTGDTATGLTAGTYILKVVSSCDDTDTATAMVTITQPTAIKAVSHTTSVTNTSSCNGTATLTVSGGTAPYTYSWAGGGTTNSISGKCAGTYCCTITDAHGCTDTPCVTIISTLGINNINNASAIKVYPNPTNGQITVSGLKQGEVIELYNYMGQRLSSAMVNNNSTMQLNIADRTSGIYMLKIEDSQGKLIAEKQVMKVQ